MNALPVWVDGFECENSPTLRNLRFELAVQWELSILGNSAPNGLREIFGPKRGEIPRM